MADMLAAVYHGPKTIHLERAPIPEPGPGEMLLKVGAACICGTDLRILHGGHRKYFPGSRRIPGHEATGVIAALGPGVTGFEIGQAVFVAPNWGCGHCRQCVSGQNNRCAAYGAIGITVDGAFAEYVRLPAPALAQGNVIALHPEIDPAQAALIEPLACVLRGQDALHIQPGESVLVMGAGPIGILHLLLARLRGAGRLLVSEPEPERLGRALAFGADAGVNPAAADLNDFVRSQTQGLGADVILVAAPSPQAQQAALQAAAIGGRINFFGGLPKDRPWVQIDANLVHYNELLVTGTTACSTHDCWRAAEIVNSGRLDLSELISQRFPLEQIQAAFAAAEDRKTLKVAVVP